MENYFQHGDVALFGIHIKVFPLGIQEAFEHLMETFGVDRSYYGISWYSDNGTIEYYAMVPEAFAGEAKKYNYYELTIPEGQYHCTTIFDWLSKTGLIRDVFHELTAGYCPTKNRPCIEWYRSDQELICMIKAS